MLYSTDGGADRACCGAQDGVPISRLNADDNDFKDHWQQLAYMHCLTTACRDDVRFAVPWARELYSIDRSNKFDGVLLTSAGAWCRVERPKQRRTLTERHTAGTQVVRNAPDAPTTERLDVEQELWHVTESQLTFLFFIIKHLFACKVMDVRGRYQTCATLSGAPVTLESVASF